jgi:hypothetical protein
MKNEKQIMIEGVIKSAACACNAAEVNDATFCKQHCDSLLLGCEKDREVKIKCKVASN